ncbi:hypothetical protein NZ47_08405 [Anaerovibrio lipolyticus]|uniref:Lipoprotein n=1 Tax=Anaerovibrio lipolyticus TaxID=82374 RepID=A0A0B2JU00_9FIRM|nr:hypothetical protein [Anaerovibrio lipolyticus]KHM51785.1 hypothetical protein NZ47_08405 [Anaerovibrio lipolyticus]
MKQKLFVFICLISLVVFSGCGLDQCDTPEEVITKIFSGELKSADEVKKLFYIIGDEDKASPYTLMGEEVYTATGFNNRANYENEFIKKVLNIDHVENLKIKKIVRSDTTFTPNSYYKVSGTIHNKDGSTEIMNNSVVHVVPNSNEKNERTKYLVNITPIYERLDFSRYAFGRGDEKTFGIQLSAHYCGDSICFIAFIENFSDDEYIMAEWPNGANVIWGDKSVRLQKPVIINSKNNPIGQLSYNRGKYHAFVVSYFDLGKIVTPEEAKELLKKNNSLIINYLIAGENGLPSMRSKKQQLVLDDIGKQ